MSAMSPSTTPSPSAPTVRGRTVAGWIAAVMAALVVVLMLLSGLPTSGHGISIAPVGHGLLPVSAAQARPIPLAGGPTLGLLPVSGTVHATVGATGAGFSASARVNLTWGSFSPGGTVLSPSTCSAGTLSGSQITATASGGFVCSFLVPGALPGSYLVSANNGTHLANATFTVLYYSPESVSATYYGSTGIALPAASARTCSINATKGACTVPGTSLTPYLNTSNDPTLNHTSTGLLALAYTSYSNGTAPCVGARPYSTSNIAFQSSSNDGASWTSPIYLGNPVCSSSTNGPNLYPSAWEPRLTSLGNGTLVMAYIEYNSSAPFIPPFYNLSALPLARLVVTESYNGGTSWTTPTPVNVSNPDPSVTVVFEPYHPSIMAHGKTIYLVWMNLAEPSYPQVYSHVAMVVSTSGGKSWSPTIEIDSSYANSANPNVLVTPSGRLFIAYDTYISYDYYSGKPLYASVVVATSATNGTSFSTSYVNYGLSVNATWGVAFNPDPVLAWTRFGVVDVAFVGGVYANGGSASGVYFYYSSTYYSWSQSYAATTVVYDPSQVYATAPNANRIVTLAMTPMATNSGNIFLSASVFNGSACVAGACGAYMQMGFNTSNNGTSFRGPFILSGWVMPNGTVGSWRPYLLGEYSAAINYPGATAGSNHLFAAWPNATCPSWAGYPRSSIAQCGNLYYNATTGRPTTLWGTSTIQLSQSLSGGTTVAVTFNPKNLPWDATWSLTFQGGGNRYTANGSTNITVSNVPTGLLIYYNVTSQLQYNSSFQFQPPAAVGSPQAFTAKTTIPLLFTAWVPLTIQANPSYLSGSNCQMNYGCSPGYFSPPSFFPDTGSCVGAGQWYGYCTTGCVGSIYDYYNYPYYYYYYSYYGIEYQTFGCSDAYVSHNVSGAPGVPLPVGSVTYVPVGAKYTLNITHWSPLSVLCGQGTPPPLPTPSSSSYYSWFYDECWNIYVAQLRAISWFGSGPGNVTSASTSITVSPTGPVTETVNFALIGACSGYYAYYNAYSYRGGAWYSYHYNGTSCVPIGNGTPGPSFGVPFQLTEQGLPTGTAWTVTMVSGNVTDTETTANVTMTFPSLNLGSTFHVYVSTIPSSPSGSYWIGSANATVTMPDFNPFIVTFTKRSLSGLGFAASISESGLPLGAAWTAVLSNTSTSLTFTTPQGWVQPVVDYVTLSGGTSYSLNGSTYYGTNGTAYYVQSVNVTFATANVSPTNVAPGTSVTVTGMGQLVLIYAPMYWLTVLAGQGGSASPSSRWVHSGLSVTLMATNLSGYTFVGWTGLGNGSVSSTKNPITVKVSTSPVTELANFRTTPAITYKLQVQASGLPAGVTYSLSLNGVTYSGSGTFAITNLSRGSYAFGASVVYSSPVVNTRWVPVLNGISTSYGGTTNPVNITSDGTVTITYKVQYLLSIPTTAGGTVTASSAGPWFDSGNTTSLTAHAFNPAVPVTGYHFVSWNGSGVGSVSGTTPTITVTMTSPVTEIAQFAHNPNPPPRTYHLAVSESGLPTGTAWNVTLGSVGNSTSATSLLIAGLNGTYTVTIPIVAGAPGIRYNPNVTGVSTPVLANATLSIRFSTQYLLSVTVSGNGTVSQGSAWVDSGTQVTLVAAQNASWQFAGWIGSTQGTSPTIVVTVNSPSTETAQFTPIYPPSKSPSVLTGAPIAFGLLVALLAAGLGVAYVVVRRRGGRPPREPAMEEAASEEPPMAEEPQPPEAP